MFESNVVRSVKITRAWQLFSYQLFKTGMPKDIPDKELRKRWHAFYDHDAGFTNKSAGYDFIPKGATDIVHLADFVNKIDVTSPLPKWDKERLSGGMCVTGREEGNELVVYTLRADTIPSLEWLLERPWFIIRALYVLKDGRVDDFPLAQGGQALMPLVSQTGEMRFDKRLFRKLPAGITKLPDPRKLYTS